MTSARVPETPLPEVGDSGEEAHALISKRFQEHTDIEIEKGNRLQASEKIWASVAHALKAVAEDRGWRNESHSDLNAISSQLGRESRSERSFRNYYNSVNFMHHNFYENDIQWDDIALAQQDAQEFIAILEDIRQKPPRPFTPRNRSDQNRLARLLDREPPRRSSQGQITAHYNRVFPLGVQDVNGFSPNYGYEPPDGGDSGGSGGNPPMPPRGNSPSGGQCRPRPSNPVLTTETVSALGQSPSDTGLKLVGEDVEIEMSSPSPSERRTTRESSARYSGSPGQRSKSGRVPRGRPNSRRNAPAEIRSFARRAKPR